MKNKLITLVVAALILAGCNTTQKPHENTQTQKTKYDVPAGEHMMQAVLWQELSAEHRALCYQAFNTAKLRLNIILSKKIHRAKPLAIVTDIDESILDNSPFNGKLIQENKEYTGKEWSEWVKLEKATAIPGAVEFLQYAKKRGVEVFYITNRSIKQQQETMENLRKLGFPYIDNKHFLMKENTSSKKSRREKVRETHDVVMLIGDNLADFNHLFDNQSTKNRNLIVDSLRNEFGSKYIMLPNPMYGDWETKGLYDGNYHWTEHQRDSIRHAKLISY
ncbi:MAG: 5'-nucleotidase, lipoprotein e(P4) family [Bacteroidales bacterium]|nr:5'-nucleotidase, lipoprotein e(P4) family [Bacteroidales bacterium]